LQVALTYLRSNFTKRKFKIIFQWTMIVLDLLNVGEGVYLVSIK